MATQSSLWPATESLGCFVYSSATSNSNLTNTIQPSFIEKKVEAHGRSHLQVIKARFEPGLLDSGPSPSRLFCRITEY